MDKKHSSRLPLLLIGGLCLCNSLYGQSMSTNPPRLYFTALPGERETRILTVMNTGKTPLELGISVGDWDYDPLGNNRMYDAGTLATSAAGWIRIFPSSYLVLQAGQRENLEISLKVPANTGDSVPVHTAMIFLTQLNLSDAGTARGAAIQISIRSGTKVYHSFFSEETQSLEITDFKKIPPHSKDSIANLELTLSVNGKRWVEGDLSSELLHIESGKKTRLAGVHYYALPGDERLIRLRLPPGLAAGRYTATSLVSTGDKDQLKMAELEFILP
ncbi:MAG: hypothetical protein AB7D05_01775 [Mangrovibacterium sp.]